MNIDRIWELDTHNPLCNLNYLGGVIFLALLKSITISFVLDVFKTVSKLMAVRISGNAGFDVRENKPLKALHGNRW